MAERLIGISGGSGLYEMNGLEVLREETVRTPFGDPSGRSATRPVLSGEEIDAHARTYVEQAGKVLATDERLEVRRNSEWLDMSMEDLFRLVRRVTVAQLPEHHREVFVLRELEGKSYEDIAEITNCNLGTVKSRLNRARNRFAQVVAPHLD